MAVGNMADDLTELNLGEKQKISSDGSSYGRRRRRSYISEHSPLILESVRKFGEDRKEISSHLGQAVQNINDGGESSSMGGACGLGLFRGVSNVEIVKDIGERTGLPAYLINDANAGALAKKNCTRRPGGFAYPYK